MKYDVRRGRMEEELQEEARVLRLEGVLAQRDEGDA